MSWMKPPLPLIVVALLLPSLSTPSFSTENDCEQCGIQKPPQNPPVRTETYEDILKKISTIEPSPIPRTRFDPKTQEELLEYLGCYMGNKEFEAFKKNYLPSIQAASEVSGIPTSILSCFYYRESRFNPDAKSHMGAIGLAQFMPATAKTMNQLIFKNSENWLPRYFKENLATLKTKYKDQKEVTNALNLISHLIPNAKNEKGEIQSYTIAKDKRTLEEIEKQLRVIQESVRRDSTINYWRSTLQNAIKAKSARTLWKEYFSKKKIKKPTTFDPKIADHAIIGGAIYLRDLEKTITPTPSKNLDITHFTLLAAAYNSGPGNFLKYCKYTDSTDQCIQKIPFKETKEYMKRIRNCASYGSNEPTFNGAINQCEKDQKENKKQAEKS